MNILITGSNGFIGRNLALTLKNQDGLCVMEVNRDTSPEQLEAYCRDCDFVFHLAGVNRPEKTEEFAEGNAGFTARLLALLEQAGNACPVMLASSVQAGLDHPYGRSKRDAEALVFEHGKKTGARACVYRLPNVFGKWARPDYNSVVATFCYHISREEPIKVHDPSVKLELVYIDDLVEEMRSALVGNAHMEGRYGRVLPGYQKTVGEIAASIESFSEMNDRRELPDLSDPFTRKLYSTYISYLPGDKLRYGLTMHCDPRGSFTEMLRTGTSGQISVNISKPHIVKGNHWHHTKHEKFLVVKGEGVIRLRRPEEKEILEIPVSGQCLEVVEIPPGYTHNIENTGEEDMVTVMWADEAFDPEHPDTYYMEV